MNRVNRHLTLTQRTSHLQQQVVALRQANAAQLHRNVVLLEPNSDGEFDYWLRISTLEAGKVIRPPVKLSAYHHRAIGNLTPNSSVILTRKRDGWWLTLTVDDDVPKVETTGKVGVDVGIYTNRENRPNQQTFCCGVCGFYTNADDNAALNIEARLGDREISACKTRDEIKALLAVRHALAAQLMAVVHPPAQLGFQWA